MRLLFTLLLSLMAGMGALIAQGSTISGTVKNANNKPMEFVAVLLDGTTKGATTDADGVYHIREVEPGKYTLTFSSLGYEKKAIRINVVENRDKRVAPETLELTGENLNEVTVTGRKQRYVENKVSNSLRQQTEIAKLPQNIQVISSELLRDQQVTNMLEGVVRNVSGVMLKEHWGHFANATMRGFRLPAFRNGFNFSDSWGALSEDMSIVDQVEFVKGPAGFMLSAGEPGGFYNVVTKKPTATPIGDVTIMAGSFDFYRAAVDLGGKVTKDGKLLYRLNGMYQTTDTHRGDEDASRFAIAPVLNYKISDKTSVTAELTYQEAEAYIGSAYIFAPVHVGYGGLDRNFKMTDNTFPATEITEIMAFANLNHRFSSDWSITLRGGHMNYDQTGNSAWSGGVEENGDVYRYVNIWDAVSLGNFAQVFVNGQAATGNVSHTILAGVDYTDREYYADFSQGVTSEVPINIFEPTYGTFPAPNFDRSEDLRDRKPDPYSGAQSTALYVQDELGLFDGRARLTLAGRFTSLETVNKDETDTKVTPRVGLSVDLTESLTAYGLFDQSFLAARGVSASGETFDPIDAIDVEGGLKKSFFQGRVRASLGAYVITKKNILVSDPENPMFSVQLGEVQSKGIEFDLQGRVTKGLNAIFNYANTNVEITEDTDPAIVGQKVSGHARHVINAWVTYNFADESSLKGFGASLGGRSMMDRATWAWGADNNTDLPDYFSMDGALFWNGDKFRVQLNVNNLLDEYLYSGANYGSYLYWQSEPGINARLAVTYSFR